MHDFTSLSIRGRREAVKRASLRLSGVLDKTIGASPRPAAFCHYGGLIGFWKNIAACFRPI